MTVSFTAHNIRLDDGSLTRPDSDFGGMDEYPWLKAARRLFETVFPGDKSQYRLVDLGCLEGGYAVEFARMGFNVLGIEVRDANIAACNYVKERVNLPNLQFVQDDAWNVAQYGQFDVVFCSGLFYHLDKPIQFLNLLRSVTKKLLFLQTHFAPTDEQDARTYNLSPLTENEGVPGRWYREFANEAQYQKREELRWASWDNWKSFWIRREYLLQAISAAGFPLVLEQFDCLGPDIAAEMTTGFYKTNSRSTFIGIRN